MSGFFVYICTRTTADPYLPPLALDVRTLSRDVSDAFSAIAGGYERAGQLSLYPLQRSVPNHLLCDGKEVAKASFPELYGYLQDTQGTPVDAANFLLPNYLGTFAPATAAEAETVNEGTVSTPAPAGAPVNPYDNYGDVDSGGRRFTKWTAGEI